MGQEAVGLSGLYPFQMFGGHVGVSVGLQGKGEHEEKKQDKLAFHGSL